MKQPIFKSIFGENWHELPTVMKKHYANRSYCDDISEASGTMKIDGSLIWNLCSPISRIFGILVPYTGENIEVIVKFRSSVENNHFVFDRTFYFPNKKPYKFYSTLIPQENGEVVEIMNLGLGWKCEYCWQEGRVLLRHKGYVLKLFGKILSFPIGGLIGKGYAEEIPIDEDSFAMKMEIVHPWWGKLMGYSGTFKMSALGIVNTG